MNGIQTILSRLDVSRRTSLFGFLLFAVMTCIFLYGPVLVVAILSFTT